MLTIQRKMPTLAVFLLAVLLAACSPSAAGVMSPTVPTAALEPTNPHVAAATYTPEAARTSTATNVVEASRTPTDLKLVTYTPTPTAVASATSAPTATPQPLAVLQEGATAWCLPQGMLYTKHWLETTAVPEKARTGAWEKGAFEVNHLPAAVCAFLYQFNQPVPRGVMLEVYELGQARPWLSAELMPLTDQPDTAAALLRHPYIIEPPFWDISYEFKVRDASGAELSVNRVNLHRPKPNLCYNGLPPDLNTMLCPLQQDLHPWDYGYSTPWPTLTPHPDE